MFRDYDSYGRRNGRSPYITNIPGPTRQQTMDPVNEIMRLRQQLEQSQSETAEWRQAAEKYHSIAKQQQAEAKLAAQKLAQMGQKTITLENIQKAEAETKKSAQSAKSVEEEKTENEWQEKYIRLYADLENSKKRLAQRYAQESRQNQAEFLRDMLPLADNLERAIVHAETDPDGLRLIQKAFLETLAKYGVAQVAAAERPFNPELHEAIGIVDHDTAEPGTIVAVTENGYTYNGNLLRPAKVLVAR